MTYNIVQNMVGSTFCVLRSIRVDSMPKQQCDNRRVGRGKLMHIIYKL